MNQTDRDRLLALFRHAAADAPAGPHVADDEELLTAWRLGELSAAEDARFHEHLATCPGCRRFVAELAEVDPPAAESEAAAETASTSTSKTEPTPAKFPWRGVVGVLAALAACVVIAVGWMALPNSAANELVRAEAEVNEGKPDAALARLLRVPSDKLSAVDRARRDRLLERAAYETIRGDLEAGRHDEAGSRYTVAMAAGASSSRLDGLKVIADNRLPLNPPLTTDGSLLDRGYMPDGAHPAMDVSVPKDGVRAAWESVLARDPKDPAVLLAAGDYLLSQRRLPEARDLFRKAAQQSPNNPAAHVGLGLVAAAEEQFAAALPHFQKAHELAPDSPAVMIDLAVCYEATNDAAKARPLWERALERTTDPKLRDRIAKHLKKQ